MLTQNKNNFNFLLTWKTSICILLSKETTSYGNMSEGSLKHNIRYILTINLYWRDFRIRHGLDTWAYFLTYDMNENRSFSTGRYFRISVQIILWLYPNKSIIEKRTNQLKKLLAGNQTARSSLQHKKIISRQDECWTQDFHLVGVANGQS